VYGKSNLKPAIQKTSVEHTPDWYSTETIAKQLLDPVVSEVEKAEYQGSVSPLGLFSWIFKSSE
jgi:hypothetical protein